MQRGAVHFLGLFLLLCLVLGVVMLFGAWNRIGQLEQVVVSQEKRIHDLEIKLEVISVKAH